MSLLSDTSLDMATINDPVPATQFVESPDAQPIDNITDEQYYGASGGGGQIFAPSNAVDDEETSDDIKEIQEYFFNPDDELKHIIGNEKYTGPVDGKINDELRNFSFNLESKMANILNTNNVFGVILLTNLNDIKESIKNINKYQQYKKLAKMSIQDRFAKISSFLR